ncbi:thiamine phosphate synthase [Luteolibacter sp. AS25]|uniref:thiamine phosphate synthase n=1 Tax=Luteolibacter sp. AS25 TaxID=3135776 RepID=UPI00398BA003
MSQDRRSMLSGALLYGIVDYGYVSPEKMGSVCRELIDGGADVIQLRAKGIDKDSVKEKAKELLPICRSAGIPFILNDYPEMAVEIDADGVHVGQDDGEISEVRKIVGEKMLIGRSTHSLPQAIKALSDDVDYIGYGPLFPTPTKAGRPAIGLDEVAEMEALVGNSLPAFCIGGIKQENLQEVIFAGARRCVIVSSLLTAENISAATNAAKQSLSPA